MHKGLEELKHSISYREFVSWQEYYQEEPFLSDRLELILARLGQVTALSGMSELKLDDDYFFVSKEFRKQNLETKNNNSQTLAKTLKDIFEVKGE